MKMSDAFELPYYIGICSFDGFESREQTESAVHAINNYDKLVKALETIAKWNDHTVEFAVDYGSNGVRDYYRNLAKVALINAGETK